MPRPIGLALLWLVATATAVALAWGAVQLVADRVAEQPPGGPLARLSSVTPTPAVTSPAPTPSGGTATPTGPSTTIPPAATTPPQATTPPPPSTPDATAPAAEPVTRSYTLVGGTVVVRFSPTRVEVLSASPNPGFTLEPLDRKGPLEVRVEFNSEDHRSRLRVSWDGGPRAEIDEDERD